MTKIGLEIKLLWFLLRRNPMRLRMFTASLHIYAVAKTERRQVVLHFLFCGLCRTINFYFLKLSSSLFASEERF